MFSLLTRLWTGRGPQRSRDGGRRGGVQCLSLSPRTSVVGPQPDDRTVTGPDSGCLAESLRSAPSSVTGTHGLLPRSAADEDVEGRWPSAALDSGLGGGPAGGAGGLGEVRDGRVVWAEYPATAL